MSELNRPHDQHTSRGDVMIGLRQVADMKLNPVPLGL